MSPVQLPWDLRIAVDGTSFPDRAQENDESLGLAIPPQAGVVTTLPTSPTDGMEIYYVADATNGVVWKFRYTASLTGLKWAFVGGGPLVAPIINGFEATASTTYVDLATVGPTLTMPSAFTSMDLMVTMTCGLVPAAIANEYAICAPKFGAAATLDNDALYVKSESGVGVGNDARTSCVQRRNGIAGGAVVKMQYRTLAGNSSQFGRREMLITPVRVG